MYNLVNKIIIPFKIKLLLGFVLIIHFISLTQVNDKNPNPNLNFFFEQYELSKYDWIVKNDSLYLNLFNSIESKKTADYLRIIYCLTMSNQYLGNYTKAIKNILDVVTIAKEIYGDNSRDFAGIVGNLAQIYFQLGELEKALDLLDKCEKVRNIHPYSEVAVLLQIGIIHERNRNYSLAISAYEKINSRNDSLINSNITITALVHLAELYGRLNLMESSIGYINKALEFSHKCKDSLKDTYYVILSNRGSIYSDMGNYNAAINDYNECELYYLTNENYADYNLVQMYKVFTFIQNNQIKKAKECFNKIHKNNIVDFAYFYFVKGILEYEDHSYKTALNSFNKAKNEFAKTDVFDQLNSINQYIIKCSMEMTQYHKLDSIICSDLENSYLKYNKNKLGLSNQESIYIKSELTNKLLFDFGYALHRRKENPEIIKRIYAIWFKVNGELNEQNRRLKNLVLESAETDLINLFYRINILKSNNYQSIEAEKLEREFQRKISQNLYNVSDVTYLTLTNNLINLNAIFLDFVSLPKYNFNTKQWTESSQHLVFISDSKDTIVEFVVIEDGTTIDQIVFGLYNQQAMDIDTKTDLKSGVFYNSFWKPIADKIGDAKTIYVSLGGVYNNINLNTLYNPETGKYLIEEKDIRIVNSARDFVLSKEQEKKIYTTNTASLFGFPDFNGNTTIAVDNTDFLASTRDLNSFWLDSLSRGGLKADPLPATKIEVENISLTLKSKGWQVNSYLAENASETTIKKQESPRILHIATHGYFFPDIPIEKDNNRFLGMDRQQVIQDPMLRSGLLFTGANRTLKGEESKGENGLLSAAEASLLDLRETELVVLSACETGKGEVKNSEGVYGLRKAFSDAGAKNIIMSLWKVDDKVTQEFMSRFYEIWLNDKTSIREAFNKTQLEIKAKYPEPYYWGAFILVGE